MTRTKAGRLALGAAVAALMSTGISTTGAWAQEGAGAYLAARHAGHQGDYEAAARYFVQAMLENPGYLPVMDKAIAAQVGAGRMPQAITIAKNLRMAGGTSQIADMVLTADDALSGDYGAILAALDSGKDIGPLVDGLVRAWALVGQGDMPAASSAFDDVVATPGLAGFALYHKALALATSGDLAGAEEIFASPAGEAISKSRRGAKARIQILSAMGEQERALSLLTGLFGADVGPGIARMKTQLETGQTLGFDLVENAREGIAEIFFSVASALDGELEDDFTLMYIRMATHLDPTHTDAILKSAQVLERMGQFDLATAAYDMVPREDPAYLSAELGRSDAMRRAGRPDTALEILQQLTETHGTLPRVHTRLGDALRRARRYEEAKEAYAKALDLYGDAAPWALFYHRGITHERSGQWDAAEADFRTALAKRPDQPQVLNYLGYSLLEKNLKLTEALEMIDRAAKARPNAGHIIDSLGWAFYRLGRHEEAVTQLERATELEPVDPTINDHLGDAYWAVGRVTEARFQWQRALSFGPNAKTADRIRMKLEIGLDQVYQLENVKVQQVAQDEPVLEDG
ncbi:tetratricopeptide repeat protein [Aestuariibius sp. 2305UL40-4]|uniref:tetratricopeptide repeat protein n=1 Tax=Aestuariibius violaceus TaxID=3234132 RepID=UPI00345E3F62